MNYEKQMKDFYSTLNYNSVSSNAIAIYTIILLIANNVGRFEEISIANSRLSCLCNLTTKQFQTARNELINKNYIDYQKGSNKNNAPKYSILKLSSDYNNQNRTIRSISNGVSTGVSGGVSTRATTGVH